MAGLFGELHQHSRIADAGRKAQEAGYAAGETRRYVRQLEDRVDQLTMIVQAMWKMLQVRTGMTDEQLIQQVEAIDLSDGKLDGKVRKDLMKCPACGRALAPRHMRCMYCGAEAKSNDVFDRVL